MTATRIIVMEDERILALHMKQQLVKLGYDVVAITSSGEKALEKIRELRPDVALMDIHVEGGMDGVETAARIPTEFELPVIYITAYSEEATLQRARATKPYGYIIKPFSGRELHAAIQMALERRRAESALRASEDRLDRAQQMARIGSWELDIASGNCVWSKEYYRICDLPIDFRPTRENLAASSHADDVQPLSDWLADLQAGRERDPIEIRITRPDGETRLLRITGCPVIETDCTIRRLAGTTQDITERRLIEQQLVQAQKMEAIGNLTGGMAHDFNNVLGVIMGNLELLRRLVKENTVASELCGEILDGASRCADLIQRLLAFARRQPLRPQRTDVNALVNDIVRLLGRTLGEDIALTLELDTELWPALADPAQLEAALVNLATNARDAMPKGGKLDIVTRNTQLDAGYAALHPGVGPGDYVLIEISDTGTGIPREIIDRIFEPFFTTKAPGKGSGLGLSMAFGFVKQSGGHLSVYSEPGLGATFRLYLPRNDAEQAAPPDVSDVGAVMGGNETVLVVEDNAQLRLATVRQLAELGYQVRDADHADAALTILSTGDHVDLLFTDVVMPGTLDGVDLAHQATHLRPRLKVLLTSGFPGARSIDQRMANWPARLINKPYRRDELARAVREALDNVNGNPTAGCLSTPDRS